MTSAFGAGSKAAEDFKLAVETQVGFIKKYLDTENPNLKTKIEAPWKAAKGEDGELLSFSKKVEETLKQAVTDAQGIQEGQYGTLGGILGEQWDNAQESVTNWYNHVNSKLDQAVLDAQSKAAEIESILDIDVPSYSSILLGSSSDDNSSSSTSGGGSGGKKGDKGGGGGGGNESETSHYQYDPIGGYGESPLEKETRNGEKIRSFDNGKTWIKDRDTDIKVTDRLITYDYEGAPRYTYDPNTGRASRYAKGTLATKKDQWAITDEPQFGDELVLIPNKEGNLSYMRKGTSVVPASITENLVEWGKLNPNMMNMLGTTGGINLMSNYISKPEIKLDIENFLRCDNVSKDSMPELKKFVNEQINNLAKQLNYGLRRVGAN